MDSQDNSQDCHDGDSDDEIAELRFQALLTKRENEAEVSPAHEPRPMMDNLAHNSINQPLSSYHSMTNPYQQYSSRGRGFHNQQPYKQAYLQTFSQQMASSSVNSSNIVVLTSSNDTYPAQSKDEWNRGRGRGSGASGSWPRMRGNFHPGLPPPVSSATSSLHPTPQLVLPQDKYAAQPKVSTETSEVNKTKLSARMRRLQGSDSDSEDSDSDSSDDSSSDSSSSDSNSSSSDSSSSGSDSDSDDSTAPATKKASEKALKKDKVGKPENGNSHPPSNSKSSLGTQVKQPNLVSASAEGMTKVLSSNSEFSSKKSGAVLNSPALQQPVSPVGKLFSQSSPARRSLSKDRKYSSPPRYRIRSRSPRYRSPSPGFKKYRKNSSPFYPARTFSPKKYSPVPSRSPLGRYSRSPKYKRRLSKSPVRVVVHSPLRRLGSKSPVSTIRKYSPLSPNVRYKSRSKSPILRPKRYISRSPVHHRSSPSPARIRCRSRSRSPYVVRKIRVGSKSPTRYRSRSPVRPLRRFTPPKSPMPNKRFTSISPPPFRRLSRSPPVHRILSPLPRRRSSRSLSPRRYSPSRARSPFYKSKERSPVPPRRRKSLSPRGKRFVSRSPKSSLPRSQMSPLPPSKRMHSPSPPRRLMSPQAIRRVGSPLSPKSHPTIPKVSAYGSPGRKRHSPPFRKIYRPSSRSPKRSRLSPRRPLSPLKRISPIKSSQFTRGRSRPLSPRDLRHLSRSPPYLSKRLSPTQRVSPNLKENRNNLIVPLMKMSTYQSKLDNFQGSHIPRDKLDSYGEFNSSQKRLSSPINRPNSVNPPPKRYVTSDNSTAQWNRAPPSPHFGQKHLHTQITGPAHSNESNWPPGAPSQQDRNYNMPPRGPHFQPNRSFDRNYDITYQGPPSLMERNFDLPNRGPPPRLDRFVDSGNVHPSQQLPARGRGNRGLNRGFSPRGGNQPRIPSKAPWVLQENLQNFELGSNQDKHFKESHQQGPPPLKNAERFPDRSSVSEKFVPHKPLSPPIKRKGPQTPPDPPKRDPSPLEYQKLLHHDRTPSLSPSPSRKNEHFSKLDQETDLARRDNFIKADKNRNSPHKIHREKEKINVSRKERENVDSRQSMAKKSGFIPDNMQNRSLKEPNDGANLKHSSKERKPDIKYKEHSSTNMDEVISHESQHRVCHYPRLNDVPKESIRNKNYLRSDRLSNESLRDGDRLNIEGSKLSDKIDQDYREKSNADYPRTFDRSNKGEFIRDSSKSFKSTRPIRREPSNEIGGQSAHVSSNEREKTNQDIKHDHSKSRLVSNTNARKGHSKDRRDINKEERKHDEDKAKKETEIKRKKEEIKPLKIERIKHCPKMLDDDKEILNKKAISKEDVVPKTVKVKKPEVENTVEVKEEKKSKPKKMEKKKLKDGDDKKKKKKKIKEEDKKAKKKKKEKKKKKDSKKHRKINKVSESEEESPKKKKEKVSVKAIEEDLRQTLTRGDRVDLEKERAPKRKRDYSAERYIEKSRQEEETPWQGLNRGNREIEEYYGAEDRYHDEYKTRRVDRERDRSLTRDDNGLLVTVGSNIDRQVVPKGSRTQTGKHMQSSNKGPNMQVESRESSRVPVKLRLSRPIDADRTSENIDRGSHDRIRGREDTRVKGILNRQRRGGGKNMERRRQNNR